MESAAVSSRYEHGSTSPVVEYGSGSDSDDQPTPSQYSFKDVAKEIAYELLSKDDAPQSKRRESDKIRDREYLSEIYEEGDLDGME